VERHAGHVKPMNHFTGQPMKPGDTYVCNCCRTVQETDWDDTSAEDEAVRVFGEVPDDAVIVCDDCYRAMMAIAGADVEWSATPGSSPK